MSASPGVRLHLEAVSRRIAGRSILEGVQLEARAGEMVAVVGKSGCGKTSLLRLIAGLDTPTSGAVRLEAGPGQSVRGLVRMVFQEARLLPWRRVIDNVGLGQPRDEAHCRAAAEALARVGLGGRERDWPGVLSGGEKQRVALARALVGRPGLLLLDEPLGALDAFTRLEMQRLLENIWIERRFTTVLVTHDVQEAVALADRVVCLASGRVASTLEIDLPRPRDRLSPPFTAFVAEVLDRLGGEGRSERPQLTATAGRTLTSVR
jgi:sulfonate transport system ATP-binding protein